MKRNQKNQKKKMDVPRRIQTRLDDKDNSFPRKQKYLIRYYNDEDNMKYKI